MEKPQQAQSKSRARWKLILILMVCAAPMLLSYLTYYVIKPQAKTNYGTLLDPRDYPMPALHLQLLGETADSPGALTAYRGKWIMLMVADAGCDEGCQKKLYDMRQLRLAQGKEMDRIERVWLIPGQQAVDISLLKQYDGMHVMRAESGELQRWLPVEAGQGLQNHLYLIDPLGNLMMRYRDDADPNKVKKDLIKLLKASSIG